MRSAGEPHVACGLPKEIARLAETGVMASIVYLHQIYPPECYALSLSAAHSGIDRFVAAGLPPATRLSRLENPMPNGDIEYLS